MPESFRKLTFKKEDTEKWWTPTWRKAVENGYLIQRDLKTGQMSDSTGKYDLNDELRSDESSIALSPEEDLAKIRHSDGLRRFRGERGAVWGFFPAGCHAAENCGARA